MMRRRALAAAAAVGIVALGVAMRHFGTGSALVTKLVPVALWAALVYVLLVVVAPRWPARQVAVVALAISAAIECLQLTPLPAALSARHVLLRYIFGTTFSWPDLPAYAVGVLASFAIDRAVSSPRQ